MCCKIAYKSLVSSLEKKKWYLSQNWATEIWKKYLKNIMVYKKMILCVIKNYMYIVYMYVACGTEVCKLRIADLQTPVVK